MLEHRLQSLFTQSCSAFRVTLWAKCLILSTAKVGSITVVDSYLLFSHPEIIEDSYYIININLKMYTVQYTHGPVGLLVEPAHPLGVGEDLTRPHSSRHL